MSRKLSQTLRCIFAGLLLLLLAACSKISVENYQKLSLGMSRTEVVALLGEPTQSDASDLLGVSGETAVWQHGDIKIEATLINKKLIARSMSKQ
jgi:hypothetical protein